MQARAAIYLDANAGAPLSAAAIESILPLLADAGASVQTGGPPRAFSAAILGNPSSTHSEGRSSKRRLRQAREQIARSLGPGVRPEDLIFTSSGTEANQMAVRAVLEPMLLRGEKPHWILTAGEHDAHMQMIRWLEARGGSVSLLPLCADGSLDLGKLDLLWRPETSLVSAVWVNNETGVISDIEALAREAQRRGVPLHLDGAQAWGKLVLDLPATGARLASFSGHKIGALAGTGILWHAPEMAKIVAQGALFPGKQEGGLRGGTENLLGAVALGAAASALDPVAWAREMGPLRERLEQEIKRAIPGARIHGQGAARVANTINLGFEGVEHDGLVMALDLAGYCVSSGSACSSGVTQPSHVLQAMGLSDARARSALRISLPPGISWRELEGFVPALSQAVEKHRQKEKLA
jgi:cysteine desulfurase